MPRYQVHFTTEMHGWANVEAEDEESAKDMVLGGEVDITHDYVHVETFATEVIEEPEVLAMNPPEYSL